MKGIGLKLAFTLIAAAMVFLLADIVVLAAFDGSLADIATEYYHSEPSIAIVQRALASVVFLVAGLMLASRKHLLGIVDGLMKRLERSVAVPGSVGSASVGSGRR